MKTFLFFLFAVLSHLALAQNTLSFTYDAGGNRLKMSRVTQAPTPPGIQTSVGRDAQGRQTAALTATGCAGTVRWNTGAVGPTLTLTGPNFSGVYTAYCTVGGCETSSSLNLGVNREAAPEPVWAEWTVSPNPSMGDAVFVRYGSGAESLRLFDGLGRELAFRSEPGENGLTLKPSQHLPPGVYLLRAEGERPRTIRFLVHD